MAKDDVSVETRGRLLRAAIEVFAEKGYRNTTLREICGRAEANIAAVNYHFGDKERLYEAVIDHAIALGEAKQPRELDPQCSSPESRLRQIVTGVLNHLLGDDRPTDQVIQLMSRELIEPTPSLDRMIEIGVRPFHQMLAGIVEELLGTAATPELVRDCPLSIMAQCVYYHHSVAVIERLFPIDVHSQSTIDSLIDHIMQFSLGGIQALAEQALPEQALPESAAVAK